MMSSDLENRIKQWKQPPDGFFQWLDDIKPKIPSSKGGFEVFQIQDFQREFIENALKVDEQGDYVYQTLICSMPRRHSKTVLMALLCLWRFTLWPTQNIIALANNATQATGVSFRLLRQIASNTNFLREQIGTRNIQHQKIVYPAMQSQIIPVSTEIQGLYGQKISVAWVTELHSCPDPEAVNVLASSLGDTENSWLLIDSTTDAVGGRLHEYEKLAETGQDESVYSYRIEYKNLDEALKKSPEWINRKWLKSMSKQLLPSVFAQQHLNKRGESSNNLFPKKHLDKCKAQYKNGIDPKSFEALLDGRKYVTGGALDRSYMFSKHGDNTIWTTVARTSGDDGEAYYYVLNQKKILGGLGKSIKKEIINDNARYGLKNTVFEAYNSQDLATWATEQGLNNEIIHVTASNSLAAFQDFSALVREGRLFFPAELEDLYKELSLFHYTYNKNGNIQFGSSKRKDDRVYSLLWSIYSLRKEETTVYELGDIRCNSLSKHAPYCFLRSGDLILSCADRCPAAVQTKQFYEQYRSNNPETELTLPEFFQRLVKVKGFKTYKAM
jgi:hypothetical protein